MSINYMHPKVCYKKYLGPDWTPSYENPSTIISNHVSYLDIAMLMCRYLPSWCSDDQVERMPLIGTLARRAGTMYLNRED